MHISSGIPSSRNIDRPLLYEVVAVSNPTISSISKKNSILLQLLECRVSSFLSSADGEVHPTIPTKVDQMNETELRKPYVITPANVWSVVLLHL